MKFNCGETRLEKHSRVIVWHRWFAWHPVRVGSHDCRWLEWIERKGKWHNGMAVAHLTGWWDWEYRPIVRGRKWAYG